MKISSIPSKYETVLHRDPNERNGFGNRTLRFGDCENELPGPGQYYKQPSLVRSTIDSGSVSRLGYSTGFVSKSKRFNEQVKVVVPGPGQYQPSRDDRKTMNRKHGMSSFVNTPKRSNNQSPNVSVPGPADYNAAQPSSAYAHNVSKAHTSAAFHTGNTDRFGRLPGKVVTDGELGPGTYETPTLADKLAEKQGSASVFKSKTSRTEGIEGTPRKGNVPGPAFYHPTSPEKRSHLLNANKKWL
ncbi:Sperm-tail PG-rich repeat [Phytophthora cinnamomi]|uniref:Sperm-tail PG-rich repeat n=1 Tax=Phytophthora cinnamomi TaxID=4785 RepID=UPI0035593EFA|nr:Sperm-tail PG-rich repeat [Phytophthora cinnamomi]